MLVLYYNNGINAVYDLGSLSSVLKILLERLKV